MVAVNEAGESQQEGYRAAPVRSVEFSMADLPWLKAVNVYRVGDGRLDPITAVRSRGTLTWGTESLHAGEVYMVCRSKTLAADLVKDYLAKAPKATPEGTQMRPESHLNGRRKTTP